MDTIPVKSRRTVLNIKSSNYSGRNINLHKSKSLTSNIVKPKPKTLNNKTITVPKDINQFKHLISQFTITPSDLEWAFQLRAYERSLSSSSSFNNSDAANNKKQNTTTIPNPPSFYEEDFAKHRKKAKLRLLYSNEPFYKGTNSFTLYHLIQRSKACSVNPTLLNFGSTLRDFDSSKKLFKSNSNPNWINLAYRPVYNEMQSSYLPPLLAKSKEKYKRLDSYILKKYKIAMQKVKYRNETINKKTVVEDSTHLPIYSCAHLSMGKYTPTYESKNIGQIRHLLKQSNSTAKFEIGLREGFELTTRNFNNKLRENNIKQSALSKNKTVNKFKRLTNLE